LSSSLQKKKNPKSVKKNIQTKKDGEETEPEKAWVLPAPSSRTLTIIVFVQSRGIRKHRPKAFFPNTISKGEKKKTETKEQEGRTLGNKKSRAKERKTKAEETHRDQNHCCYCLRYFQNQVSTLLFPRFSF
jgi:hypothetical protein